MNKKALLFLIVCLAVCLIPSVGTLFFPTNETTENRAMAAPPKILTEDGSFNTKVFGEFTDWFEEHMALRNQLVCADAVIQKGLFRESNVPGVIAGTDGWLYYSSTLDDYLGRNVLSDRDLYGLANNLEIVQDYLEARGIGFVFTVPPNKNTLYGEHMPYYDGMIVNPDHSAKLLKPYLEERGINYLDLFDMFGSRDEVLYLKGDSHWNNKGACMVYNSIMDALGLDHEDYSSVTPKTVNNEIGDLNKMLYSFYGKPEENFDYGTEHRYSYTSGDDVEDGWIVTENGEGQGTLLMFRDSFANTLIPFLSDEFGKACYSKSIPNHMERLVEENAPGCVVVEKVERNITDYLENPPILTPPACEIAQTVEIVSSETTARLAPCENDVNYYVLEGAADLKYLKDDYRIFVSPDGDPLNSYPAYITGNGNYRLYLRADMFTGGTADIRVYAASGAVCTQILETELALQG